MEAASACSRVSGSRDHEDDNNDDANNYGNNPRLSERQTRIDRLLDTIVRANRRVRFDSLKRSHDLLTRVLENERQRCDNLVHPFLNQNPNPYRWEDIDDAAEVSEEQVKAAALRVRGLIHRIDECRLQQRLNYMMAAATPPRLGPYSPLLLAANDDRDEEVDEKELMCITYSSRLFGNY